MDLEAIVDCLEAATKPQQHSHEDGNVGDNIITPENQKV